MAYIVEAVEAVEAFRTASPGDSLVTDEHEANLSQPARELLRAGGGDDRGRLADARDLLFFRLRRDAGGPPRRAAQSELEGVEL